MVEKTKVVHMEHFDQNESNGNAATKYIVEFSGRVNCDWLWLVLEKALVLAQQDKVVDLQTATNTGSRKCPFLFVEHYACNGEFSHWAVIDVETGEEKWAHPASA